MSGRCHDCFFALLLHGCSHDDRPTDFRAQGAESNTISAEQSRCTITKNIEPAAQHDHHTTSTNSGVLASARERNQSPTEAEQQNSVTWKLGRAKITKRSVTGRPEAGAQRRSGFSRAFQQCSARYRDMSVEMDADHLSVTPAEPENSSAIYVPRTCENNVKYVPTKNHHQTWDPNDGEWRAPRNHTTQFSSVPTLVMRTHLDAMWSGPRIVAGILRLHHHTGTSANTEIHRLQKIFRVRRTAHTCPECS